MQPVEPFGRGRSKYDPLPAALDSSGTPFDPRADPLVALLRTPVPEGNSKYDPARAVLDVDPEAPGTARGDLLGALVQMHAPEGGSKYDPFREALSAEPAPPGPPPANPLKALLSVPSGDGKYDPLPGVLAADVSPAKAERLDLFRGLIKALAKPREAGKQEGAREDVSGDLQDILDPRKAGGLPDPQIHAPKVGSKYDPFREAVSAEPATPASPLKGLLSAPSGDGKYDPLPGVLAADVSPTKAERLDLFRGLIKALAKPRGAGKQEGAQEDVSGDLQAPLDPRKAGDLPDLQMRASEGGSKYDPFREALKAEPAPSASPLKALLSGPSGDGKYDPLPGVLAADVSPAKAERLDLFRGLIKALAKPRGAGKQQGAQENVGGDLQALLDPRKAGDLPDPQLHIPAPTQALATDVEVVAVDVLEPDTTPDAVPHKSLDRVDQGLGGSSTRQPEGVDAEPDDSRELPKISSHEASTKPRQQEALRAERGPETPTPSQATASRWNFWSRFSRRRQGPVETPPPRGSALESAGTSGEGESISSIPQLPQQPVGQQSSQDGASQPSTESAVKGTTTGGVLPEQGVPSAPGLGEIDPTDPRLTADERAAVISLQAPFKRPFAAVDDRNTWPQSAASSEPAELKYQRAASGAHPGSEQVRVSGTRACNLQKSSL